MGEKRRGEEGFVFRAYPLFKEGKKGGGEKKDIQGETNRENYIYRVLDRDENPSNRRIIPLETPVETSHDAFILE